MDVAFQLLLKILITILGRYVHQQELTVLVCGDIVSFYALASRLVLPIFKVQNGRTVCGAFTEQKIQASSKNGITIGYTVSTTQILN